MKAKLYQQDGTVKGQIDLPEDVFGAQVNESLLHQVITQFLANQRQGTAKTKSRAEVSGGGRKPWRQKGTGRARAGSNTSPVWVRGGKAHGPEPRDYYSEIPKKMRRLALASALSSRAKDEKVMVVESISCETPKTRTIADLLKALSVSGQKNLLIIDKEGRNVFLSGRNIRDLEIRPVSEINAYDVLTNENIIFADERLIGKVQEAVAL
ncbi:MAG TPA: 50S ribosomal protein L4 [Chitinispirillaceae bacterium]|nr:50S ribosomal protein L4 [Chitinispirillaceae bacterium]